MADGAATNNGSATRTFLGVVATVSGAVIAVLAVVSITATASEYLRQQETELRNEINRLDSRMSTLEAGQKQILDAIKKKPPVQSSPFAGLVPGALTEAQKEAALKAYLEALLEQMK